MERMLLVSASMMNRRALALAIVLLIAGLAPASAIVGFCTRMPCCSHAPDAKLALVTERGDCCTTITCYDTPSAKLTTGASSAASNAVESALAVFVPALHLAPPVAHTFTDTSPPRAVSDRLAILSILLI
jgi:hypothetical protein